MQIFDSYPSIDKLLNQGAIFIPVTQVSDGPDNSDPDHFPNIAGYAPLYGACHIASSTLSKTNNQRTSTVRVIDPLSAFSPISIVQTSEYCQLFLSANLPLIPTKSRIFNCLYLFVSSHFIVAIISREAKR